MSTGTDLFAALANFLHAPGHPGGALSLLDRVSSANKRRTSLRLTSWSTVSLAAMPEHRPTDGNLVALKRCMIDANGGAEMESAAIRLARRMPLRWDLWALQALQARRAGRREKADRCLMRAAIIAPSTPKPYSDLAAAIYQARRFDWTEKLLVRCKLLAPLDHRHHYDAAVAIASQMQIDHAPSVRFMTPFRRWLILEPDLAARGDNALRHLRWIGDWRSMVMISRWVGIAKAASGMGTSGDIAAADFLRFEDEVRAMAPLEITRSYPPRTLRPRVLIHPKLPDDGPWRLVGPAAQVERARRILAFVNPTAILYSEDDPGAARIVSLVPHEDSDAWYFPCLYGHWHTYWTVLPAILDDDGVVSMERLISFCIRTRQFVTFWYAKGHERAYLLRNAGLGQAIARRMSDTASRQSYLLTLAAERPAYIRQFFERLCQRVQYFDYAVYRPGDVILNLGVAEGFEIPAYAALTAPGGVIHNIDPDGYSVLGEPARAWIAGGSCTVHLHEIALSDVDGVIEMDTGACWEDSRVAKRSAGQFRKIPSRRLDSFVRDHALDRIDHVKLDIEGGEGFLVDQLIDLMRTHRPQIEISIYHTVEQFIEIPDRMMRETVDYRFYFDHYCGHFGEGTLYAIPKEIEPVLPV